MKPSPVRDLRVPYEIKDARAMMGEAFRLKDETAIKILFHSMTLQTVVPVEEDLPIDPARDLITYNLVTRQGVVDIAVFHADGSATVIVVRDGTKGERHVESGLQTLPILAAQLSESSGAETLVRRAMLWTSTGDVIADAKIYLACRAANAIALSWGTLADHITACQAVWDAAPKPLHLCESPAEELQS